MDVFDLQALLSLNTDGYEKKLNEAKSSASSFGGAFGKVASGIGTATKVVASAVGVVSTGIGALTASAVKSYATYEQLEGGVETLFGTGGQNLQDFIDNFDGTVEQATETYEKLTNAQNTVMANASNAYKTAGMSANEYMETVTSFSASLIQSLGGDTEKASEYADKAITDMSDNANKMGTSMESIENAYQGFAKQNYTMLDNLKLGYGGTKSEMERLITDAEKLDSSFVAQKDSSGKLTMSYADIVDAIHIVQDEMGITGTTMKEATSTIEGSLNMLKASWSNLVTGLADENANIDELADNVIESLVGITDETTGEKIQKGFLDNVIPVVETALTSIGTLIEKLVPDALDLIPPLINDVLPKITNAATELVGGLISAFSDNMDTISSVISQIVNAIVNLLPDIISLGGQIASTLATAIMDNLDKILEAAGQILEMILTGLSNNAEKLSSGAVEIITKLVGFITDNIDLVLNSAIEIVNGLANGLLENLDVLLEAGLELLMAIVSAIPDFIVKLADSLPDIIDTIVNFLTGDGLVDIINAATEMFLGLVKALPDVLVALVDALVGIIDSVVQLMSGDGSSEILEAALVMFLEIVAAVPEILGALLGAIGELLVGVTKAINTYASNMKSAAVELWGKITEAVEEVAGEIADKIKEKLEEWKTAISDKVNDFKEVGKNLITGLWNGISDKAQWLYDKISGMGSTVVDKVKSIFGIASPSKVFAEIGGYLAEGLELGWEDEIDDVNNKIEKDLQYQGEIDITTKTSEVTAPITKSANNSESGFENTRLVLNNTTVIDGEVIEEKSYTYMIRRMGDELTATKIAEGGGY